MRIYPAPARGDPVGPDIFCPVLEIVGNMELPGGHRRIQESLIDRLTKMGCQKLLHRLKGLAVFKHSLPRRRKAGLLKIPAGHFIGQPKPGPRQALLGADKLAGIRRGAGGICRLDVLSRLQVSDHPRANAFQELAFTVPLAYPPDISRPACVRLDENRETGRHLCRHRLRVKIILGILDALYDRRQIGNAADLIRLGPLPEVNYILRQDSVRLKGNVPVRAFPFDPVGQRAQKFIQLHSAADNVICPRRVQEILAQKVGLDYLQLQRDFRPGIYDLLDKDFSVVNLPPQQH